ncbi:Concanavalin A-like lectin/glucanases superfamily protein [Dyadobacter soli]|uniref:Concanavalin A-like lectin/glucanases superfamily protein n=1 Tax=Dyadobacter soli TaxID=659014 RepID=A0A1G7JFM6_9BACT|nr:LamG domain-containing protein [Dyadobacter soli]SDF23675.1 Concanavalin A-like lectin/glucanases superfamily protein [Dyadobacter soli]
MKTLKNTLTVALCATTMLGVTSCYEKFDPESYAPNVTIGGFTSSDEIAKANLVAHFPFDGNYSDVVSNTAGTNTGTTFANGLKGQAMKGAKDGYVLFDPTAAILGLKSFTMTYWVNSPSTKSQGGIIGLVGLSQMNGFWGNVETFFENGGTDTDGIFKAHIQNDKKDTWVTKEGIVSIYNSWNHIALSYDATSSTFSLYVNGSKTTTATVANFGDLKWQKPGKMVFGTVQFQTKPSLTSEAAAQDWASYLTGLLDEVRIYNVALKDAEVDALVKLESRGK